MGGHGGLNILPQKRWNVYNFDNRERVKRDEEAAAREEQIQQQQEREKEAENRLVKLREAANRRGSSSNGTYDVNGNRGTVESEPADPRENRDNGGEMRHINLFEGLIGFQKVQPRVAGAKVYKGDSDVDKQIFRGDKELERLHKRATKEAIKVGKDGVEADDEHYKLGYGCLGRDRKRPWYLTKGSLTNEFPNGAGDADRSEASVKSVEKRKKTIDELREERLKREQREREKAGRLFAPHSNGQIQKSGVKDFGSKRHPYYNSSFGNAP